MILYGANISTGAGQLGGRLIFLLFMFFITRDNLFIFVSCQNCLIWLELTTFVLEVRTFVFLILRLRICCRFNSSVISRDGFSYICHTTYALNSVAIITLSINIFAISKTFNYGKCIYDKYNWAEAKGSNLLDE